jgi:hypothetical protein
MKKNLILIITFLLGSLTMSAQTGNALYFDGTNDYIDFGTFSAVDFSNGFTFTCLVKWDVAQKSVSSPIIDFSNGYMSNNIKIIKSSANKIITYIYKGSILNSNTWSADISTNEWIFLALTIDSKGNANLYLNGDLVETATLAVPKSVDRTMCYLGRSKSILSSTYFNGFMDEVSLWNKKLTQSEITSGMNSGFSSDADSLLAYFKFNQGTSKGTNTDETTLVNKASSGSLAGTLKNFALTGSTSNWVAILNGSGTSSDPYQIATIDDLSWMSINSSFWNKKYVQTSDIDASSTSAWNSGRGFIPIGNSTTAFTGSYNGKRHEINSLTINCPSTDYVGLFGRASGCDLDSIGITDGTVTGSGDTGGLIGYAYNNSTINYCHFNGNVTGYSDVGGFAGDISYSTVTDSYSTGNAVATSADAGGFIGTIYYGTAKYCYTTANASSQMNEAGDFAGTVSYGSNVNYCYSRGNSSAISYESGGFASNCQNLGTINHCYSTGTSSGAVYIGGFIGIICRVSKIYNSFFNTETSKTKTIYGDNSGSYDITGITSAAMRLQKTFLAKGWDFAGETANGTEDKMVMSPDVNDGFPCFIWQGTLTSPVLTTDKVSDITSDSAIVAGSITSLGFPDPYVYGICWNTTGNPSVNDSRTNLGVALAIGSFADTLTSLKDGTTYYARAYAINSADTAYGQILSFTTKSYADITWQNPADITYGSALSNTQLNAVANTVGSFVYKPSAGSILPVGRNQQLITTFTPSDQSIYVVTKKTVVINVNKATPVITWESPADIAYGAALGNDQLNATSDMEGVFSYNPASGTVLQAGNNQKLIVTFTPADTSNYSIVTDSVYLNIRQLTPVLTWENPDDIVYGTGLGAEQLDATADLEGTFSYNPDVGTILSAGLSQKLTVTFIPGNSNYSIQKDSAYINVSKAAPVISWNNPIDITYGSQLDDTQLNATSSITGTLSYYPAAGTVLDAGNNQMLTLAFIPDDAVNYSNVKDTIYINILRAPLTIINAKVTDKTYNGVNDAVITGAELSGVVDNDEVILTDYSSGNFSQSTVGTNIPVTSNMSIEGHDISNYILSEINSLTGNIVARTVSVSGSFSATDKAYDGNTAVSINENNLSLVNIVDNDYVTLEPVAKFDSSDAADDIQVILTADSYLKGDDSGNYILSLEGAPTTTASIIQYYTLTALEGSNGSIDPSGSLTVKKGSSQIFTIIPDDGYYISKLLVDGVNIAVVNTFTFNNISDNHTIEASFDIKTDVINTGDTEISLYPNPTSDELHIVNASGYTIKLVNMQGITLIIKSIDSNNESVSLSSFPSGTYFIVCENKIVKVIKK